MKRCLVAALVTAAFIASLAYVQRHWACRMFGPVTWNDGFSVQSVPAVRRCDWR